MEWWTIFYIYMKNLNLWTYSNYLRLKLRINSTKRIKIVISDHGGEYYGRCDNTREQRLRLFVKYLEECRIVLQYTMSRSPSMNGVVERRNGIVKHMIRSMICHFTLSKSLWGETLKTTTYILNYMLTKATTKIPYEL